MVEIVGRLRSSSSIAVVFSAHELNPLLNAIDRVLYLGQGAAALGSVDEVVNSATLSRLYGAEVEVVRVRDRMFVMAGGVEVEREAHAHGSCACGRMFEYEFMRTAFAAAGAAAVLSGAVGYFLVLRGQTFAGHALSHVGFTGATGAALLGLAAAGGADRLFRARGSRAWGCSARNIRERDVAIGMTLSLALGLGLLFLHFYTSAASQATALLFGNVLGVDRRALTSCCRSPASASPRSRPSPGR